MLNIKMLVLTGQPKCLILLENDQVPTINLMDDLNCEKIARNYIYNNFGFAEPWCLIKLAGILSDEHTIDIYYATFIAEETKIKYGKWCNIFEKNNLTDKELEIIQRMIWQY